MNGASPVPHYIIAKQTKIVIFINDFTFTRYIIQVAKRLPNFLLPPSSFLLVNTDLRGAARLDKSVFAELSENPPLRDTT